MKKVEFCECPICGKLYREEDNCEIGLPVKTDKEHYTKCFDVCPKCGKKWRKVLKKTFGKTPKSNDVFKSVKLNDWQKNIITTYSPSIKNVLL